MERQLSSLELVVLGKELVAALQSRNYVVRQLTTGKPNVGKGIYSWSPGTPGRVTSSGTVSGDPGFIDKDALKVKPTYLFQCFLCLFVFF